MPQDELTTRTKVLATIGVMLARSPQETAAVSTSRVRWKFPSPT